MRTKLTLTIDKQVVDKAKLYAKKKNRSVSKLVEEYLNPFLRPKQQCLLFLQYPLILLTKSLECSKTSIKDKTIKNSSKMH